MTSSDFSTAFLFCFCLDILQCLDTDLTASPVHYDPIYHLLLLNTISKSEMEIPMFPVQHASVSVQVCGVVPLCGVSPPVDQDIHHQ